MLLDVVSSLEKANALIGTLVPFGAGLMKLIGIVDAYGAAITFAIGALVGLTSLIINLYRIHDYRKRRNRNDGTAA